MEPQTSIITPTRAIIVDTFVDGTPGDCYEAIVLEVDGVSVDLDPAQALRLASDLARRAATLTDSPQLVA